MVYLSALALALPPGSIQASGEPATGVFTTVVLLATLLWAILLCWWARPARRSTKWLADACLLVMERSSLVTRLTLSYREPPGTTRETPEQNRKKLLMFWNEPPYLPLAQREVLHRAGFTSAQIDQFLLYRRAYRAGHYHPDLLAPARLHFARWLYQHGKLSG